MDHALNQARHSRALGCLAGLHRPHCTAPPSIKKLTRGNPTMAAKFSELPGSWSFFELYFLKYAS